VIPDVRPDIYRPGNGGLYGDDSLFYNSKGLEVPVDADGVWTMTAVVPMTSPGPSKVMAWCEPSAGSVGSEVEFDYPGVPVSVSSPFRLDVLQGTSVVAGTRIQVNLVGGGCPNPASDAYLNLYTRAGKDVADAAAEMVRGWPWSLLVPKALAPGRYQLEADCVLGRGAVEGSYAPLILTVR
jgi:hypothetical protein